MIKAQHCEEQEPVVKNNCNVQSHTSPQTLKSKLERRRQIEELNEERRLHKEFHDF